MISGNNNRSPQYGTMGPKGDRSSNYHYQQQQQQQPHLLFMAGGSVRRFPQMSQGFSTMPNATPLRPTVVHCNMQQNFGGGYGYSSNSAPIFQPHYQYQQPAAIPVHYQAPMQYVHQSYMNTPIPPAATHIAPTSGFINGIKNMVKGLIQPLNCDFYSDHHKYYNPKYRKNYMRDIASEKMSYTPHQPEAHVKTVVFDCVNIGECKPAASPEFVPKKNQTAVPQINPKTTASEVLAIFTSEDFPELPAPRRNRSTTPAKTEKSPERLTELHAECAKSKQSSPVPTPGSPSHKNSTATPATPLKEPSPSSDAKPKSMFFEIKCTTIPCGRRPTFGGRFKIVPPPFSFNKSHRTCRTNCQESKPQADCDTEDDSFVIFRNERPDECILTSLGTCRPQRQRQISECSDDSFVVFSADDVENIMPTSDETDDESIDDDDESDDDEDDGLESGEETSSEEEDGDSDSDEDNEEWIDDKGHDVVDFHASKTDSNKCAGESLLNPELYFAKDENEEFDSGFERKKVSFNLKPVVHVMHTWNYAYRAARKGHWENYVRDRDRFRVRIERASTLLNPVLTPEHREKIYRERFCDKSDEQPHQQEQKQPQQEQQQQQEEKVQTNSSKTDIRSAHNSTIQSDDSQILPKSAEITLC